MFKTLIHKASRSAVIAVMFFNTLPPTVVNSNPSWMPSFQQNAKESGTDRVPFHKHFSITAKVIKCSTPIHKASHSVVIAVMFFNTLPPCELLTKIFPNIYSNQYQGCRIVSISSSRSNKQESCMLCRLQFTPNTHLLLEQRFFTNTFTHIDQ